MCVVLVRAARVSGGVWSRCRVGAGGSTAPLVGFGKSGSGVAFVGPGGGDLAAPGRRGLEQEVGAAGGVPGGGVGLGQRCDVTGTGGGRVL